MPLFSPHPNERYKRGKKGKSFISIPHPPSSMIENGQKDTYFTGTLRKIKVSSSYIFMNGSHLS
jgi:hypothetical protein